jgi:hypothetical protein
MKLCQGFFTIIGLKFLLILPCEMLHTYKAHLFNFITERTVLFLQRELGYALSF